MPRIRISISVGVGLLLLTRSSAFLPSKTLFKYYGHSAFVSSSNRISKRSDEIHSRASPPTLLSAARTHKSILTVDKTREEVNFVTTALLKNSLFSDISETSLKELVNGFELNEAKQGEELVAQGDSRTITPISFWKENAKSSWTGM